MEQATTGRQADSALRNGLYELVVLDIGLPDIDGFEVLRRCAFATPRRMSSC